jgi:hypothetical protein
MTNDAARSIPRLGTVHVATGDDLLDAYLRQVGADHGFTVRRHFETLTLGPPPGDVMVLDERLLPAGLAGRALLDNPQAILVSDQDAAGTVRLLSTHGRLCHVLAREGGGLPRQLAATLTVLLGLDQADPRRHLAPGTALASERVGSTADKQACLDRIADAARGAGGFTDLPAVVETIASELVMNAIFNAPVDPGLKRPRYQDVARDQPLTLAPGEEVTVAFGHDDHAFVLCVRDNFGTLRRKTLAENFARAATAGAAQIRMKTPGAGVGLFMVFSSAALLEILVHGDRSTEVVAVVALSKRYRDFARSGHSVNLFFDAQEGYP